MDVRCSKCRMYKPAEDFFKDRSKKYGLSSWCKVCHTAGINEYRKTNKGKKCRRKENLKYNYVDFNIYDYNRLFKEQDGKCAICEKEKKLAVDHDHETEKVRGLLCLDCNTSLGKLGDNEWGLLAGIWYIATGNNDINILISCNEAITGMIKAFREGAFIETLHARVLAIKQENNCTRPEIDKAIFIPDKIHQQNLFANQA